MYHSRPTLRLFQVSVACNSPCALRIKNLNNSSSKPPDLVAKLTGFTGSSAMLMQSPVMALAMVLVKMMVTVMVMMWWRWNSGNSYPPLVTLTPVWTCGVSVPRAFSSAPNCHMYFDCCSQQAFTPTPPLLLPPQPSSLPVTMFAFANGPADSLFRPSTSPRYLFVCLQAESWDWRNVSSGSCFLCSTSAGQSILCYLYKIIIFVVIKLYPTVRCDSPVVCFMQMYFFFKLWMKSENCLCVVPRVGFSCLHMKEVHFTHYLCGTPALLASARDGGGAVTPCWSHAVDWAF